MDNLNSKTYGRIDISRKTLLTSIAALGLGLLFPSRAEAASSQVVGPVKYGSSTNGYYEFHGNLTLAADTEAGASSWAQFYVNHECAPGSISIDSWINYGTVRAATTRSVNSGWTDRQIVSTVSTQTTSMGGGVFAYANASLAQVAGGFFQFETVGTNPYGQRLVSMGGICGDHDGFVSALGRAGKMGLIRASDLNPSSIEKPEEYLEYVAAHEGECFIPVYDIDEQTIIDEHPVTFVVL